MAEHQDEQKKAVELQHAYEALKKLDADKSDFISIVVHQLRSPLASIRLVHQTLLENEEQNLTDEQRHLIAQAEAKAGEIDELMNDLMQIESIEEFLSRMEKQPGSIEGLIDEVLDELTVHLAQKDLSVTRMYDHAGRRDVPFDHERLKDAIMNIINNAIQYTPDGGDITVRTTYRADTVDIEIRDTGVGVNEADQQNLFKKFERLGNAADMHPDGYGLGLYVAKKVIERHHGGITYEPNEPTGSVFIITLPIVA